MKKIFYLFLISVVLVSCQKELTYGTGNPTVVVDTTGGTGSNGNTTSDCKACSYFPTCNGSRYTYNDTLMGGTPTVLVDTLKFVKDTLIQGRSFQKIFSPATQTTSFYNCTNGATTVNAYNALLVSGNTLSAISVVPIRANTAVNGTWNDTITNPAGQQVIYTYTMKAKGITHVINGVTFNDVLYITCEIGITVPGFGTIITNNSNYYFAKGVGLIDSENLDFMTGMQLNRRTVKSYYIP